MPCGCANACDPGLFCADSTDVLGRDGVACCALSCDVTSADPCPGSQGGVECIPWFDAGSAPAPSECGGDPSMVGACLLP